MAGTQRYDEEFWTTVIVRKSERNVLCTENLSLQ